MKFKCYLVKKSIVMYEDTIVLEKSVPIESRTSAGSATAGSYQFPLQSLHNSLSLGTILACQLCWNYAVLASICGKTLPLWENFSCHHEKISVVIMRKFQLSVDVEKLLHHEKISVVATAYCHLQNIYCLSPWISLHLYSWNITTVYAFQMKLFDR